MLREEDDIIRSRRVKSLSLQKLPWISPIYLRSLKRLSLGMPKASPSSSTNYQVISSETIFLFLHIICTFLGASVCFCFQFVFVLFAALYLLDPNTLVWERDKLRFFIGILLFFTYICWVFLTSYCNAFSSCFSCISCSELLVLVEKYSLVSLLNYF